MIDLKKNIAEKNFDHVLEALNGLNISKSNDDFRSEATSLLESFLACYDSTEDGASTVALRCLGLLQRSCALGESFQNIIITRDGFLERFRAILVQEKETVPENIRLSSLKLMANLCVQNKANQEKIIGQLLQSLLDNIISNGTLANASAMILYNGFLYKSSNGVTLSTLLATLMTNVEANLALQQEPPEFVTIFLEYLLCESNEILQALGELEFSQKMLLYRFMIEYVRQEDRRTRPIHPDNFKHLLGEFKKQSDEVLKTENVKLDGPATEEVFTLLVFLSDASCIEPYASFLRHDGALFLNLGCLLRQMQLLGSSGTENIFTPVQKIEEILKIRQGTDEQNIEGEMSYSLRSAVVKAIANMSYKSKKNQQMAREMDIMSAILNCTTLDARNPLIKEWSILAIHNLCDDNPENQQFIAGLTKLAMAENSLLKECNAGTIRIGPDSKPYISRKK
uniref:Ataxin-10 n=1 Tax=Anopheles albimanus TaxID=7167 RepID=A0A182F9K2_ANOAL